MYEDRTQNGDPEIHEEYLVHDTPGLGYTLPRSSCRLLTISI